MKHAVITGPTGAIGVALIEKLLKEEIQIYAVCRYFSIEYFNFNIIA